MINKNQGLLALASLSVGFSAGIAFSHYPDSQARTVNGIIHCQGKLTPYQEEQLTDWLDMVRTIDLLNKTLATQTTKEESDQTFLHSHTDPTVTTNKIKQAIKYRDTLAGRVAADSVQLGDVLNTCSPIDINHESSFIYNKRRA